MAAVTTNGYQDLRDHIQSTWKYIEIRDGSQAPVLRLECGVDPRVTWTHLAGAQTLEMQAVIKGSDADITLPKTFAGAAIFKVASGGTALSAETFTAFDMTATTDQLTITYRIEVPEVV